MKKFTKMFICIMLCFFSITLVACDDRTPEEKAFTYPTENDVVYGNGGLAVRKGDYIYFVNGYMSIEDEDHKQGKGTTHGALMLMKLDENGQVVRDEEGLLEDDYYITMSSKLAGFEATGLYISGNYLYFTSPCQENKGGEDAAGEDKVWAKEWVEFYRMKLNKTSSPELLYKSEINHTEMTYKYYDKDGKVYIVIYEKGTEDKDKKLVRVNASKQSSDKVESKVQSVTMSDKGTEIIYTLSGDNGTEIYRYDIFAKSSTHIDTMDSDSFKEIKLLSEDYIYYTDVDDNLFRRSLLNGNASSEDLNEYVGHYDKMYVVPHGDKIVAIKGNVIKFLNSKGERYTDVDTDTINFIGFTNGNVVYYDKNNKVKTLNYNDDGANIKTIAAISDMSTSYFDVAEGEDYMYFFKTVGENEYLFRLSVAYGVEAEEEMVGVYIGEDAPEV